jgi:hypothetical protein
MAVIDSRNIIGSSTSMSATKFLYNAFTAAGWASTGGMSSPEVARAALSGALTANTLVDLLNESGSAGQIDQFYISTVDATARTLRVVIIVDGTTILDATSASISSANSGGVWAGVRAASSAFQLPPIKYTNSIQLSYASSLTETGKFNTSLAYQKVT